MGRVRGGEKGGRVRGGERGRLSVGKERMWEKGEVTGWEGLMG